MIIDGRKLAQEILESIEKRVATLPFQPIFCDILVGNDPASLQYVGMKARRAEKCGFHFQQAMFDEHITTAELVTEIHALNVVEHMCGLIVQLPLPAHIDTQTVLDAIDPRIDVDCIGTTNTDLFYTNRPCPGFPTALAIVELLDTLAQDLSTKRFLVIGQGRLAGRPVTHLLTSRGYSVQTADSKTENIDALMRDADVIISAVGKPKLITGEKIKAGAIVIDAGTAEGDSGIVGDVDFDSVAPIASFISPVPGGVGPVTVAKLLENVLTVSKQKN